MNNIEKYNFVKKAREERRSLEWIGQHFGHTKEAIRQYCVKHGLSKSKKNTPIILPEEKYKLRLTKRSVQSETGCLEWCGSKTPLGYGTMSFHGKREYVHRVSYILYKGVIPEDMCVCHSCDNPKCINPEHLWLGTQGDNMKDRDKKGRHGMKKQL